MMMNLYNKIENYIKKYPTKVRVYLSVIFAVIILSNSKEVITDDDMYIILVVVFVILPIVAYYFVNWIFSEIKG